MNLCTAQIKPFKGDLEENIEKHKSFIDLASSKGADLIFFPELSLTGYEPKLAKDLSITQDDPSLEDFQKISDTKNITIGLGMPTISEAGIYISMIIFQPNKSRQTYSKQHLHSDELPYFINGKEQVILTLENKRIGLGICYESLLPEHAESVFKNGTEIYLASVAKSDMGVLKAFKHYPEIAKKYAMPVLMSNSIGPCDDFESFGRSAVWNKKGKLVAQLGESSEGILIFDTETEETILA